LRILSDEKDNDCLKINYDEDNLGFSIEKDICDLENDEKSQLGASDAFKVIYFIYKVNFTII
jgi:hypothetical protein